MASALCRQATRHRNAMTMLRSANIAPVARCSIAAARMAESPALRLRIAQNASGRGLRTLPRWNQAAEPGAAEGVAPGSAGGGKGWGAGSDGHEGTRTAGIIFFSSVVGGTACLGAWQAKRYSWKVDLIESRKARMALEPVDLPEGLEGAAVAEMMDVLDKEADGKGVKGPNGETLGGSEEGKGLLEKLEGRRVRVKGVFDHSKEVLVGPRGAPPGMNSTGPSSMATSPLGDFIHTPLRRADGSTVLFNRGWAPRSKGPTWSRPEGEVSLVGILKTAEKRGTFSPENKPGTGQLLWAEKASLLQASGCPCGGDGVMPPAILMEAVGDDNDDRRATPMTKRSRHFGEFYVSPQTHLTYAATWFSLAAAGCLMTWSRFRKRGPAAFPKYRPPPGGAGAK